MRLAMYHNLPSGGALRVLEAYLRHQGGGHEVELFLPETANDKFVSLSKFATKVHRYPLPTVHSRLSNFTQLRDIVRFGKKVAQEIDSGGFDAVLLSASQFTKAPEILPYLRTPSLYYSPEYNREIYDKPFVSLPTDVVSRLKQAVFSRRLAWIKYFDRRSIRAADRIFTHSHFAANRLTEIYQVGAEVVYLGVDTELYAPRGLSREPFVLSVGDLTPFKGHHFVIEALATLPPEQRPRLVVVGDRGTSGDDLQAQATEAGVEIDVRQNVPLAELTALYAQATVLAAAQYQEPFGLITLEAMASCTPVVAVAEGGLMETVSDGRTGLLTERDPVQFGAAIERVFSEPGLARRFGEAGRQDTLQRWQWPQTALKINQLLEATAKEPPSAVTA